MDAGPPVTIERAAVALRDGTFTARELTDALLARADAVDGELGSYLARFDGSARASAERADVRLAAEPAGPLCGIPVAIKDILAAREGPTTAQSTVLDRAWADGRDATVVRRLRDAGAVICGKATTMEFACGSPHRASEFPLPRNPWDRDRWAGGSSSGAGNGVAAGLFPAAIGTDTGGSIRIPAAFNGVTGLMPTFGLVSRAGCVPLGFTLDRVGPLARTAWDCAAVLDAIAGHDPADPDTRPGAPTRHLPEIDEPVAGLRVGVERRHLDAGAHPDVVAAFEAAVDVLAGLGVTLVDVTIPHYESVQAATMVVNSAESFAYHRNDLSGRWSEYAPFGRVLLAGGALFSSGDLTQADRVRRVGMRALHGLFADLDAILCPTTTQPAPALEVIFEVGLMGVFDRIHTAYWSGMGNPVVAFPIGFTTDERPLPLGAQIAAPPRRESVALRLAHAYQGATDWHLAQPPGAPEAVRV